MILFKYANLEKDFIIDGKTPYSLIIENPSLFKTFLSDVIRGDNERLVFSDNSEPIDINDKCLLITDILNMDFSGRKMTSQLYKHIASSLMTAERINKINILSSKITDLLEDIRLDLDYSTDFNDQLNVSDFLSVTGFKIIPESDSLLENLVEYIKIWHDLSGIKTVFIVFLTSFFSKDEIALLVKELCLMNINLFNISSFDDGKTEDFSKVIIDKDLCEI